MQSLQKLSCFRATLGGYAWSALFALCLGVAGCGSEDDPKASDDDDDESAAEEEEDGGEQDEGEAEEGGDDEGDDEAGDDDTGVGFLGGDIIDTSVCDVWSQDCPDGEKCIAYGDPPGEAWNSLKCSPIAEDAKTIGDTCTTERYSGDDDCEKGSMCYYVDESNDQGICTPLCGGTAAAPTCNDMAICTIVNDGVLTICRQECDPLLGGNDCPESAVCQIATGSGGYFVCIRDGSEDGAGFGDPCTCINCCPSGLDCMGADSFDATECDSDSCCTTFCNIDNPDETPCQGADQECVAYFGEGEAPPANTDVGLCVVPTMDG